MMVRRYYWLVLVALLAGCGGRPDPPMPTGKQIPIAPDLWDYHGNEIFPAKAGN